MRTEISHFISLVGADIIKAQVVYMRNTIVFHNISPAKQNPAFGRAMLVDSSKLLTKRHPLTSLWVPIPKT